MTRVLVWLLCFAAFSGVFLPAFARAENAYGESIEWVVADADRVFTGKVIRIEKVPGKASDLFEVATVQVCKTFKGQHTERVTFALQNYNGPVGQTWLADNVPMLFCLVARNRAWLDGELPEGVDWILREDGNRHSAIILGKPNTQKSHTIDALTRRFEVPTEAGAVTQAVADYITSIRPDWKKRAHVVHVPFGTQVQEKLWSGSAVFLKVPVDDELESLGREWCRSDSRFSRAEGAKILRYFKNDDNVAILKSLLHDPGSTIEEEYRSGLGQGPLVLVYRKRVFPVRQLAFEALKSFDVDVQPPFMEEILQSENEEKDGGNDQAPDITMRRVWIKVAAFMVGAVVVLGVCVLVWRWRRPAHFRRTAVEQRKGK